MFGLSRLKGVKFVNQNRKSSSDLPPLVPNLNLRKLAFQHKELEYFEIEGKHIVEQPQ